MSPTDFFQTMAFSYGEGEYRRGQTRWHGTIILSEHKIYLKGANGELADTFIPLEKIFRLRIGLFQPRVQIFVRLSPAMQFEAEIRGDRKQMRSFARDVVQRRCLTRKGWRLWVDPDMP